MVKELVSAPTSTVEDYLKHILLAEGEHDHLVGTGSLATALGLSPGSVSAMVKTLAETGLVEWEPYAGVRLTPVGRNLATHVLRRHRLIELLLVQTLGLDWSEVHDEAERLEHAVSERVIEAIDRHLGHPATDPHGDPIPNASGTLARAAGVALPHAAIGVPLTLVRVLDQSPSFLQRLQRNALTPGALIELVAVDEGADIVEIRETSGATLQLGLRAAAKLVVAPRPTDEE